MKRRWQLAGIVLGISVASAALVASGGEAKSSPAPLPAAAIWTQDHWTEFSQERPGILRYRQPDWSGDWNPWGLAAGACLEYVHPGDFGFVSCATATPNWLFEFHQPWNNYRLRYRDNRWGFPQGACLLEGRYQHSNVGGGPSSDWRDCNSHGAGWWQMGRNDDAAGSGFVIYTSWSGGFSPTDRCFDYESYSIQITTCGNRWNAWTLEGAPSTRFSSRIADEDRFRNEPRYVSDPSKLQAGDRLAIRSRFIAGQALYVADALLEGSSHDGGYRVGETPRSPAPATINRPGERSTFIVREILDPDRYGDLWRSNGFAETPSFTALRLGCWQGSVIRNGSVLTCSAGAESLELLLLASRPAHPTYADRLTELRSNSNTTGFALLGRRPGETIWSTFGMVGQVDTKGDVVTRIFGQMTGVRGIQDRLPNHQFEVWLLPDESSPQ